MLIRIEKIIDESIITENEAAEMSDEEIVSLLQEDVIDLLDDATWTVIRE